MTDANETQTQTQIDSTRDAAFFHALRALTSLLIAGAGRWASAIKHKLPTVDGIQLYFGWPSSAAIITAGSQSAPLLVEVQPAKEVKQGRKTQILANGKDGLTVSPACTDWPMIARAILFGLIRLAEPGQEREEHNKDGSVKKGADGKPSIKFVKLTPEFKAALRAVGFINGDKLSTDRDLSVTGQLEDSLKHALATVAESLDGGKLPDVPAIAASADKAAQKGRMYLLAPDVTDSEVFAKLPKVRAAEALNTDGWLGIRDDEGRLAPSPKPFLAFVTIDADGNGTIVSGVRMVLPEEKQDQQ